MKKETVAGVVMLVPLVGLFLVYSHASITVTNTPHAVATVAAPTPTPIPSPQPWDLATSAMAHTAIVG